MGCPEWPRISMGPSLKPHGLPVAELKTWRLDVGPRKAPLWVGGFHPMTSIRVFWGIGIRNRKKQKNMDALEGMRVKQWIQKKMWVKTYHKPIDPSWDLWTWCKNSWAILRKYWCIGCKHPNRDGGFVFHFFGRWWEQTLWKDTKCATCCSCSWATSHKSWSDCIGSRLT